MMTLLFIVVFKASACAKKNLVRKLVTVSLGVLEPYRKAARPVAPHCPYCMGQHGGTYVPLIEAYNMDVI